MPINTTTTFQSAFKESYGEASEAMKEQQNLTAPFWESIKVSSLKPSARGIYTPMVMTGNESGGAINENEAFSDPDSVTPVPSVIYTKTLAYPFTLTGKLLELAKQGQKVAFTEGQETVMMDTLHRAVSDQERQANGTGTGQITLANGAGVASASLTVDDPFRFREGMKIDAWTALGGTKEINNISITAVNYTTKVLTLASVQTWTDNDLIVKAGKADGVTALSDAKELAGVDAVVDATTYSTTFESVSVSTYPQFKANVVDANSNPISQDYLLQAYNQAAFRGNKKPTKLLSNYGQARNFIASELQKVRYEPGAVESGATVIKWGTMTWVVSPFAPIGSTYFLNDNFEKFQTRDLHIADYDGKQVRAIYGRDGLGGYYRYEGNLGLIQGRNSLAKIINGTEPTF